MSAALTVVAALIAAPAQLASALSGAWVHWQAWRPIDAGTTAQARLVRTAVPVGVYGVAQSDLADLRVVDDAGKEVPFVVDTPQPRQVETWYAALSDVGFVPGRYTQAVADAGTSRTLHDALSLTIPQSESDFFEWVAVDASDDRDTWRIVRDRAPIFRFLSDGLQGQQTITFSPTSSRWLRVRVLDGRRRFPIDGAMISRDIVTAPAVTPLNAIVTPDPQSPARQSWWSADLGIDHVAVTRVSFTASQPAFHRPITVSVSDDGKTYTEVAQGDIYREGGSKKLYVDVSEGRGRYWRVTVYNRDDQPIDGLRVYLSTTPQYVVFRQMPDRDYFLLYGNGRATRAEYDFATLTPREQRDSATLVTTGAESKNVAYQSPEPWTERHGWVLWVALLAAVVIIGTLAIRSMRPR